MNALAIKKGQTREKAAGLPEMGTLRCDSCGEEFVIGHQPTPADKRIAENQASLKAGGLVRGRIQVLLEPVS